MVFARATGKREAVMETPMANTKSRHKEAEMTVQVSDSFLFSGKKRPQYSIARDNT